MQNIQEIKEVIYSLEAVHFPNFYFFRQGGPKHSHEYPDKLSAPWHNETRAPPTPVFMF